MEESVFQAKIALLQLADKSRPDIDLLTIEKAIDFAYSAHKGQLRASGEPYILHPIAVAEIITEQRLDSTSIITAVLHDVVEDTDVTYEDIAENFGTEVAKIVDGTTKLTKLEYQPLHVKQAENLRKLLLAMSEDVRVLLVKLADRIHNMRTIHYIADKEKRLRIAHETMEIYSPLAERIGLHSFKNELQDLAFAVMYPEIRNSVINRMLFLRSRGKELMTEIEDTLCSLLRNNGIVADICGREKTAYSIWRKMNTKNILFEQIGDIVAFRIIVPNIDACYSALGIIHTHYKYIPDGFKDYISITKANGYQSLHTLVLGNAQRIEIQIRTYEMHEVATYGIAAHWAYKQTIQNVTVETTQFKWINELIEILQNTSSPEEILDNTKLQIYSDQVFCFTPNGEVISLPKGASPVDFAFAVHSKLGLSCVGAKVNGALVPLSTKLQNGDQVEIITSNNPLPPSAWENFVITAKARAAIRKSIRLSQQAKLVNLGRLVLVKGLQQAKQQYNEKKLLPLLKFFHKNSLEELLAAIGRGNISQLEVLQALDIESKPAEKRSALSFLRLSRYKKRRNNNSETHTIPVHGIMPGINLNFAHCCNPLPGDRIVGIMSVSSGVTIHRVECNALSNIHDEWIDLKWGGTGNESYIGKIRLSLLNQPGSLAKAAAAIAQSACNITHFKVLTRSQHFFDIMLEVEVKGTKQLFTLIKTLKMLDIVHNVERM